MVDEGIGMLIAVILGFGEPLLVCWIIAIQDELERNKLQKTVSQNDKGGKSNGKRQEN